MSSWDQANRRQKLGFGLEKYKENQPNYKRLLSLIVLPLNYFMSDVLQSSMGESSLCGAGDEEAEGKCGTENSRSTPAVWAPSFWATSQASATVNQK